ncbi:MAG: hypothetical protein WCJ36_00980 [Candidatus Saccharibacteria bacterium]
MENHDNLIGIHIIKKGLEKPNAFGNDILRRELGRLGVGMAVIGGDSPYLMAGEGIVLAHPTFGDNQMELGPRREYQIGAGGIEAVRTKVITPFELEERVSVINGPKLWKFDNKWEQYQVISDFSPKTIKVGVGQTPSSELFDGLNGDLLVVKADSAMGSKYVDICTRNEATADIIGMRDRFIDEEKTKEKVRANKDIIVQEYVPGLAWSGIKGVDEESRRKLANNADNTELRVYCFVDRERKIPFSQRYYATGRVFDKDMNDEWASVDQDSVPLSVWNIVDSVSDKLLRKANVPGGFFAIDLIQGDANDGLGKRTLIREINIKNPIMVAEKYNENDSLMQRKLLANLMATMAKSTGLTIK